LFPIDGLNIAQGTRGDLFGYGYLPLPLIAAKSTTGGTNIPSGDNCWTLFLNTGNFKGPVCFFTPYFWSHSAEVDAKYAGQLLDSRASDPNKAFQMETQYVPAMLAVDAKGDSFARVAPTRFPVGADGKTVVLHRLTSYKKSAMWDAVKAWFDGGAKASGAVNPAGEFVQKFRSEGDSTWQIYPDGAANDQKIGIAWKSFGKPIAADPTTYGYEWDASRVRRMSSPSGDLVVLPEYFKLKTNEKKSQWVVAAAKDVPSSTGLARVTFDRPREDAEAPYDTPDDAKSAWKMPGPVAGPFQAHLGDGSVVTYYWYRFADQPAMQHADITKAERERIQLLVEKMHREWTKDREYLAPPTVGALAKLDPVQIVQPPKGFEIGYVPIATRQELDSAATPRK
jgi:hypothetical protein